MPKNYQRVLWGDGARKWIVGYGVGIFGQKIFKSELLGKSRKDDFGKNHVGGFG